MADGTPHICEREASFLLAHYMKGAIMAKNNLPSSVVTEIVRNSANSLIDGCLECGKETMKRGLSELLDCLFANISRQLKSKLSA